MSNLPLGMTLGNFDFGFQPSIDRRQIETLATCAFIREQCTLLVQGPPGVGKTHLAVGLGVRAIEQGFRVAFYPLDELLHAMRKDAVCRRALKRKKYFKRVWWSDEVGFETISAGRQPILPTGQLPLPTGQHCDHDEQGVKDWPGILAGDEAMATAILDRLLHKSVVLNIRGRSYRLQDLEESSMGGREAAWEVPEGGRAVRRHDPSDPEVVEGASRNHNIMF